MHGELYFVDGLASDFFRDLLLHAAMVIANRSNLPYTNFDLEIQCIPYSAASQLCLGFSQYALCDPSNIGLWSTGSVVSVLPRV